MTEHQAICERIRQLFEEWEKCPLCGLRIDQEEGALLIEREGRLRRIHKVCFPVQGKIVE